MGPQHHCCGVLWLSGVGYHNVVASMGPQHHCCGVIIESKSPAMWHVASMGPQHHCCGVRNGRDGITQNIMLQWGRNITVAECALVYMDSFWLLVLQWGRNITVAE